MPIPISIKERDKCFKSSIFKIGYVLTCLFIALAQSKSCGKGIVQEISIPKKWEFYWGELLTPKEFQEKENLTKSIPVPGSWTSLGYPDYGIATYRTTIDLHQPLVNHAIYFPIINSSAKFFINGIPVDSLGTCSIELKKYSAKLSGILISVPSNTTKIEILIQVANFSYSRGGVYRTPILAPLSYLNEYLGYIKGIQNFFAGSLIAMFIYQLILFFLYKKGTPYLFLAFICFIAAIRSMVTHGGSFLLPELFPQISFETWKKLEYFLVYAVPSMFSLYIYFLFQEFAPKKPIYAFVSICIILCIMVLITPHPIYSKVLDLCHLAILCGFIYAFVVIRRAYQLDNPDAKIIFYGVLASFPFIILEIMQNSRIVSIHISFSYLVELGVLVFLLFQSYLLAHHYSLSFRKLELSNSELETKVNERTKELTKANSIREKLLSVISHDVRGPLQSLRGILTLEKNAALKPEELIQYTQTIGENLHYTNLLVDNILQWSASQLKGVKITINTFSIFDLCEEVRHTLLPLASSKNIIIQNYAGREFITSDREIIAMAIRNLVANSIKFSFRDSTIEIRSMVSSNEFTIEIKDFGRGMTNQEIETILTAGVSSVGTQKETGTGLGIRLIQDYLLYIKGKLILSSVKEKGTTAIIHITL